MLMLTLKALSCGKRAVTLNSSYSYTQTCVANVSLTFEKRESEMCACCVGKLKNFIPVHTVLMFSKMPKPITLP